jgi:hypothetical protein
MRKLVLFTPIFMTLMMSSCTQQSVTLETNPLDVSLSISGKINCASRTLTTLNPSEYLITLTDSTGLQRQTQPTADCKYIFKDLDTGHNYNIKIVRTVPSGNLTISAAGLSNYLLQSPPPPKTDLGLVAADVDRNGEINETDLVHVRRFIMGITPNLPSGDGLWRFFPSNRLTIDNNFVPISNLARWHIAHLTTSVTNFDMIQVQYTDIDLVRCN